MSWPWALGLLGVTSSLALAVLASLDRRRDRVHWSFALGMAGFALETLATLALLVGTEAVEDRRLWLAFTQLAGLALLVPWIVFVAVLGVPKGTLLPAGWRWGIAGSATLVSAVILAVTLAPGFDVSDVPGPFYAARLVATGWYGVIVQLVLSVGILAGLEACLRSSRHASRWRVKYLVLGLGGIFLVRFFLLSQALLFHVVLAAHLTTGVATLVVGNVVIAASMLRERLSGIELSVSRAVVYRSVVIGVLGLYLFVMGALGWLLHRLGVSEDLFWGSLVAFVSALAVAAVLLSEDVRWRLKRFIALNFYRSKYDYREQWTAFTTRLGSLIALEALAPQLLTEVTQAVGATRAALYIDDDRGGRYHLASAVDMPHALPAIERSLALVARLGSDPSPLLLTASRAPGGRPWLPGPLADRLPEGSVAVPLAWRGTLTGVMLLGPERTGRAYGPEDLEFLTTVGEQAAGMIVTARLTETVAQAREFEAFHRLTSFVIHDLKNSTTALSMLSQNALANFDDPEFQRDALKTLSRTVDRMKGLLGRLSPSAEPARRGFRSVDLAMVAADATKPVAGSAAVRLVTELGPVPTVSGDPDALLRVAQNLVTNAVEAIAGEGVVTVRTYEEQGWAVLAVTDTGCGISDEFLRKSLFAPFRSTKKGGWGVGLYQAKAMVEEHGGRIEVTSREGAGTTFSIRLPGQAAAGDGVGP